MPEAIFPDLPTLAWSVIKTPSFSTRIQKSASGRELRIADQAAPIWEWTLTYEILRDRWDLRGGAGPGSGYDELRLLAGFFLARRGSFEAFLYKDPTDTYVAGNYIGTGDGVATQYQIYRDFGGFFEPITAPQAVVISDDGVVVPIEQYIVNYSTGMITFTVPPLAGHIITVDLTYYFRVRFSDDSSEYENFVYQLWSAREIKFKSVLP